MNLDPNELLAQSVAYSDTAIESKMQLTSDDITKLTDIERLEGLRQDRAERKAFASKAYWMMCVYLFVVFVIIVLTGIHILHFDTTIIVTILTTTTVDVIGLFVFVMKYLFSK